MGNLELFWMRGRLDGRNWKCLIDNFRVNPLKKYALWFRSIFLEHRIELALSNVARTVLLSWTRKGNCTLLERKEGWDTRKCFLLKYYQELMRYHAVKDTHLPWKNNKESYTAGVSIYTDKPIPQSKATYNAPNFSNNFPNPNSSPSPVVPSTQLSCIPDIQNKQKWYK